MPEETHSLYSGLQFHYVKNESSLGALSKSATMMGSTMLLFGGVAVTYAACEAAMESFRGEADWKNGAVAGLAAGGKISPTPFPLLPVPHVNC